jgi:hypothetical protein
VDDDEPGSPAITAHDRRRSAVVRRLFAGGVGLGVVGAAWSALAGGTGSAGFALLVLGAAFGAVLAALVGGILAIVDEVRGAPVARRRVLVTLGFFFAGLVLLTVGAAVPV